MRLLVALLILPLVMAAPAFAQDADLTRRQEAARHLVQITTADAVLTPMINAIWPNLEMQLTAGGGAKPEPAVLDMLKTAFTDELKTTMAGVVDDFANAYAAKFTADELDAIVAFYVSPAGTKLIATQPQIMSEMLPPLTAKLQTSLPIAIQKVIDDAKAQGLMVGK